MSELTNNAPMTQADVMAGFVEDLLKSPERRRRERLERYQRTEQDARNEVFSNSQGTMGPWLRELCRMEAE